MVGFEDNLAEIQTLGGAVFAASVDPLDKAEEVAGGLSFPIGYGVSRDDADKLDSWWEDRRSIIQPSEFILDPDGKVLTSTYSSGPIGRFEAGAVVRMLKFYESRKKA